MKKKIAAVMALLVFMAVLAGCGKVTKENYEKLKLGMTYEQVTEILGQPDGKTESDMAGLGTYESWDYQSGFKGIFLIFENGKLTDKNWTEL